jgi:hypothetical protein
MTVFSNSKVDVPLTSDFQDLIGGVVKENKSWTKSLSDVIKNRGKKIKNWFTKRKDNILNIGNKIKSIVNVLKTGEDSNTNPKENNK